MGNTIGHIKHLGLKIFSIVFIVFFILIMQNIMDYHGIFDQKITFSQPYKIGDSLIFKVNGQINDTLIISEIMKTVNPDDPLSIYPKWIKTTWVSARNSKKYEEELLNVEVCKSYRSLNFENFLHYVNDSVNFYYLHFDLGSKYFQDFQKNKDCILGIKQFQYFNEIDPEKFVLKEIRWSATYGYLNFIFNDGKEYKLIKFIRNGVSHNFE